MKVMIMTESICSWSWRRRRSSWRNQSHRQISQRFQFLWRNQIKFSYKVIKVFVTGVNMCLYSKRFDCVKVMNVDVNKDSEQTTQDLLADGDECLGKWNVCWEKKSPIRSSAQHSSPLLVISCSSQVILTHKFQVIISTITFRFLALVFNL